MPKLTLKIKFVLPATTYGGDDDDDGKQRRKLFFLDRGSSFGRVRSLLDRRCRRRVTAFPQCQGSKVGEQLDASQGIKCVD